MSKKIGILVKLFYAKIYNLIKIENIKLFIAIFYL